MSDANAVVRHCERAVVAAEDVDAAAASEHLRGLAAVSSEHLADTGFAEVQADADNLAAAIDEVSALDDERRQAVQRVAVRACECYLEAAPVDAADLPALDRAAEEVQAAAEQHAETHAAVSAETVVLAAQAKAVTAERNAVLEAIEGIVEEAADLKTESTWLENVADLEGAMERERESHRRKQELEEKCAKLREKLGQESN